MSRSKKVFFLAIAIFILLLFYASYDISRRTTFPGSKPQLKERLQRKYSTPDSTVVDSVGSE